MRKVALSVAVVMAVAVSSPAFAAAKKKAAAPPPPPPNPNEAAGKLMTKGLQEVFFAPYRAQQAMQKK